MQGQGDGAGKMQRMRCQFLLKAQTPDRSRLHRSGRGTETTQAGGTEQEKSNDNIAE